MKAIAIGIVLSALGLPGTTAAQVFREVLVDSLQSTPPSVWYGDAAWGDYDADGDYDLFMTGNTRAFATAMPFSQLYLNDGDVVMPVPNPPSDEPILVPLSKYRDALSRDDPTLEDVWQSAVAWADYDNDGDLDVLATGIARGGTNTTRLYENIGGAERFAPRFDWPGVHMGDLDWGDYDNDGDYDFVVCGAAQDERPVCDLYENQTRSGGGFIRVDAGLDGLAYSSVEWGDYDNDGDLDVLTTGVAEPQAFVTRIYRNNGNGTFSALDAGLKGLLYATAAWGDYDADGDLDILVNGARLTPFFIEGQIKIYRNDNGVFSDVSSGLVGAFENDLTRGRYHGAAEWGDFNNDGRLDFFVTGAKDPRSPERGQVYRTAPNDQFLKVQNDRFDGGLFGSAFWGDYDDDGDLDLFVLGEDPNDGLMIEALRNETPPFNTLPTAPDGLQAATQGNTVTLSWNPGSDAQTPAPGLSYNLRVGTTSGGVDVVSPMATASGYRLVSRRGNAGHNTSWTLKNLPPGTYFWSVQALDSSFKGSPFAPEGTFTIGG